MAPFCASGTHVHMAPHVLRTCKGRHDLSCCIILSFIDTMKGLCRCTLRSGSRKAPFSPRHYLGYNVARDIKVRKKPVMSPAFMFEQRLLGAMFCRHPCFELRDLFLIKPHSAEHSCCKTDWCSSRGCNDICVRHCRCACHIMHLA